MQQLQELQLKAATTAATLLAQQQQLQLTEAANSNSRFLAAQGAAKKHCVLENTT